MAKSKKLAEFTEEKWQEIKSWFQEKALEIRNLESQLL